MSNLVQNTGRRVLTRRNKLWMDAEKMYCLAPFQIGETEILVVEKTEVRASVHTARMGKFKGGS